METLDMANNTLWSYDGSGAYQTMPNSWNGYVDDAYNPVLDENISDSDSSLDSPAYGLVYQSVDVACAVPCAVSDDSTPCDPAMGGYDQNGAWVYESDPLLAQVTSPNSTSTDSETIEANLDAALMPGDSSDESGLPYDDDSMEEDMSYSSSNNTQIGMDGVQNEGIESTTRPQRVSARGEHLRQVRDMIRQVNSSVDPSTVTPAKGTSTKKAKEVVNSKKRARVEPDISSVTLTREQLLTMTSEELDEFTNRLKADHTLSAHELRELKRQRRLIRNREYAQASRMKKKHVLTDLGTKFTELEDERAALIARIVAVEKENDSLRLQLGLPPVSRAPLPSIHPGSNNSVNANPKTYSQAQENDLPVAMPKAKRTARGRTATTLGASLFAFVLLAAAFSTGFGGLTTPLIPSIPFFSSPAPQTAHPAVSTPLHTQDYSTFRKMDLLTLQSATSATDDPGSPHSKEIHFAADSQPALASPTIVTMDAVLASETMVFGTNINDTFEPLEHGQQLQEPGMAA